MFRGIFHATTCVVLALVCFSATTGWAEEPTTELKPPTYEDLLTYSKPGEYIKLRQTASRA
jgi:hypothetical protein